MLTAPTETVQDLRKRAEKLFQANDSLIPELTTPEETKRLLHELQVHQVELEMQNEELRANQQYFEEMRARYFELYDLAPVGYLTLDKSGLILEANLSASDMLGLPRKFMIKMPLTRFIFSKDQDLYFLHRKKIFEAGEPEVWEMRLVHTDGTPFWVHLQAVPTKNGEYWIAFDDITQRKQLEESLYAAKQAAEASNHAKSDFLATMSHEIRTPLSSMLGNVELLEKSPLTPYQQEYLNDCKSASQILLQVINDVLDFSKIEAGKLELVNETFSVSSMSRQLVRMFSAAAKQERLELTISLADNLPKYIRCDQQRLRQIISNLLSNAIKFTRQGRVSLGITCETAVLHIVVTDTGIGIPNDKLDHIFESFTQVEDFSKRTSGGTGLGLPICRRLLALMGGSIVVSSAPGVGSVFTVVLPVEVCQAQAQAQAQSTPRNILLADDDKFSREVAQKLLQRKGYKVTAVKNGTELLDALQQNEFEIVLTDISMPVMDGTTVARIIRSDNRTGINPHIPIIAMTAHAFSEDREFFLTGNFNGYVSKPIDLEDLYRQIEELCGKASDEGGQAN